MKVRGSYCFFSTKCCWLFVIVVLCSLEMGAHQTMHGDGVKDIAFSVEDCRSLYKVKKKKKNSAVDMCAVNFVKIVIFTYYYCCYRSHVPCIQCLNSYVVSAVIYLLGACNAWSLNLAFVSCRTVWNSYCVCMVHTFVSTWCYITLFQYTHYLALAYIERSLSHTPKAHQGWHAVTYGFQLTIYG